MTITPAQQAVKIHEQIQEWDELLTRHDRLERPAGAEYQEEVARAKKALAAMQRRSDDLAAAATAWVAAKRKAVEGAQEFCLTYDVGAQKKL